MKQQDFETTDLYLSAAVTILLNTPPTFRVENGRTLFVFPVSDDLYKAMSAFNSGTPLNAYEYALTLKKLRAEMLMRRGMDGQR